MSRMKSKGYGKGDKRGTNVRQTGRTGHSLESCPTVRLSEETKAVISAFDMIAREMELKWGVGRLERLVDEPLGRKFTAQMDKFNQAIAQSKEDDIQKHGAAMKRAFQVLDQEATKIGAKQIDPNDYWEMKHPRAEGIVVRLVRTAEEMPKEKPDHVAYVAAEEMIEFVPPSVLQIKATFAGAKVTDIKPKDRFPDDPIPF